jgi:hypothetical protein
VSSRIRSRPNSGTLIDGVRFAADSLVEGDGFELPVPAREAVNRDGRRTGCPENGTDLLRNRRPDRTRRNGRPAAACPIKSRISSRSQRVCRATPSSTRRFRGRAAVSAARCASNVAGAVIRSVPEEWHPRVPTRFDQEELADWPAGPRCGPISSPPDDQRAARGRRSIRQASAPYRACRRFVHAVPNMISCRLGPLGRRIDSSP